MITVQNTINATIEKVWKMWTTPEHIQKWNSPNHNWYTSDVENDLKVGGKFRFAMNTKDKSEHFDFEGEYTKVDFFLTIAYKLTDNRTSSIHFENMENKVKITETFEPEAGNTESMQQQWCQFVIDNFKKYVESI